jgi:iron(III) transport system permease protein
MATLASVNTSAVTTSGLSGGARPSALGQADLASYVVLAVVLALVVCPIAFLVLGSFSTAKLPGEISLSELSFDNYRTVWSDPALPSIFYNTIVYATSATAIGVAIATALAWLVERTDMPGKTWIYAVVPLTLAIPGLLQAMAWVLLLSPRVGFINQLLQSTLGLTAAPFNVYSMAAMVFIEGLRLVPTAFLMMVPLLRGMDPMLEEAAATCGANPASTLRKVTLKLLLPGLLAVTIFQFITAIEAFEVPGIIGLPTGLLVFSTKIYMLMQQTATLPVYGRANALAMLYLVVALLGTYFYGRAVAHSERYSVITGKGYRPQRYRLGRLRPVASALAWGYVTLAVGLPVLVLAYVSFLPTLMRPSAAALGVLTTENYATLLNSPSIARIITNTIIMSVVAATATAVISLAISMIVVRSGFWGRRILDQLAFAPSAIPSIVLAVAFLWVFLQVDKVAPGLFGTIWSIAIAFTAAFLPYGTRAMNAAILQVHRDLEEAAYASGARQWRVMLRIFVPLVTPALVGVWIWSLLHAARVTSLPILLYEGTKSQVVAVLMWNMWQQGQLTMVAALGTSLTAVLLLVSVGVRLAGFGKGIERR